MYIAISAASALFAATPEVDATVPLDDFEADLGEWRYVGGEEFPGAKGSMEADATAAHGGAKSLKLTGDFGEGGAYVGIWRTMPDLEGRFLREIRLWVRSDHVASVGIRLGDSTGQCHQAKAVPVPVDGDWHELVLPLADLIGAEHWGGANDGKWHGPATGFGMNIGRDGLTEGSEGTLWIDDIACGVSAAPLGQPTVLAGELSQTSCRPGFGAYLTYRWDVEPMGRDFTVFVHFVGPDGAMIFQGDHEPPGGTAAWTGHVEYERTVVIPTDAPPGNYRVVVGLYDHAAAERGWDRQQLRVGPSVEADEDGKEYQIASFTVDPQAPIPRLRPPSLDLDGYRLTFSEEFDEPLDVSAWGPGTRWIAHTPYAGDFGDARFADPEEGFPFTVEDGLLRIEG